MGLCGFWLQASCQVAWPAGDSVHDVFQCIAGGMYFKVREVVE